MSSKVDGRKRPIYVDLDGSFIKSDFLLENFLSAFKIDKCIIFYCVLWLFQGIAKLKNELARRSSVNVDLLPVNDRLEAFLWQEKNLGREIVLATASTEIDAKKIVAKYRVFDRYLCSSENVNLKGDKKLRAIQDETDDFAYIGNSKDDFKLFSHCQEPYLVNPNLSVKFSRLINDFPILDIQEKAAWSLWIKQFRLYQWVKNSLIFVPLFVSGQFVHPELWLLTALAFFSFSLLASATYQINDLLDLEADRIHLRKRNRPLASGRIDIVDLIKVTAVVGCFAIVIGAFVGLGFLLALIGYLVLTLSYSSLFKRYFGMDVILLALLYTIRIFAGAEVINVIVSFWLLSFSMFIFFSLAMVKRCSEIKAAMVTNKPIAGREYNAEDYVVLMAFGVCSALLAVLTFCFYANSDVLVNQYQQPNLLWAAVPVLGYWLLRMWIKTNRNEMHDDPIVFALKDKGSLVAIAVMMISFILAHFL